MHLVFDLETTGLLPKSKGPNGRMRIASYKSMQKYNKTRIVSIGWVVLDKNLEEIERHYYIVKPKVHIPLSSIRIHGITNEYACTHGIDVAEVMLKLNTSMSACKFLVAHNMLFDKMVLLSELYRMRAKKCIGNVFRMKHFCTMLQGQKILGLGKFPKLGELLHTVCGNHATEAHNALYDTLDCSMCYKELIKMAP